MRTLILLFLPFTLTAQCKYDVDEVDKFTGTSKLETKEEVLYTGFGGSMQLSFCVYDSITFIKAHVVYTDIISVSRLDELMFIAGDSVVTLQCLDRYVADAAGDYWVLYADYYITQDQLTILQENPITDSRIYTSAGYIEKEEMNEKKAKKVMAAAGCI